MIKLKTLLDKSILNEDSNYRTPFQQGKSAGTDSELDWLNLVVELNVT